MHPPPAERGITDRRRAERGARCPATLMLHGSLRRSLVLAAGQQRVPLVCDCKLDHGHPGAHLGLAYDTGTQRGWFRWDDWGFRLGHGAARDRRRVAHQSQPRQGPGSVAAGPSQPMRAAFRAPYDTSEAAEGHRSPESTTLTPAMWALVAALTRLADVIAAEHNTARPPGSAPA